MLSRLYQTDSPFSPLPECESVRVEDKRRYHKNGRVYTMTWRSAPVIEDSYLVLVKSSAYAIQTGESYGGNPPKRGYKDFLVKSNLVI